MIPITKVIMEAEHKATRQVMLDEFAELERWLLNDIWRRYFPELLANLTQQLTMMTIQQTMMLGVMFDAKIQLETQQLMQEMSVRAHKDYRPSASMCFFGTAMRSLAAADRRAEVNASVLNIWAQQRHLGRTNVSASEGGGTDQENRLDQFRRNYCDKSDNGEGLDAICPGNGGPAATANKDIDYSRTVDHKLTLDLDFGDQTLNQDEQAVFALASNLYDSTPIIRIPETTFESKAIQQNILDVRAIAAKRSVAENSLFAIAGMKAMGSPVPLEMLGGSTLMPTSVVGLSGMGSSESTRGYMSLLLQRLGVKPEEITEFLGSRPSYYAQMEVLTKKAYQNPDFYTELYDTPVNVARKGVAMQAIGLMQDFDTLNSYLRTEMMLSLVLELEIMKMQDGVEKRIQSLTNVKR
ncbi:MAG TPA: hypothetical protein VIG74_06885 [Alphaproteobacteria bacterium]